MGCTVSGVNRNNFERALVRGVANDKRGQLLICGREKKTNLKTEKRKYSGKIELFRTTDLPKTLTTKKIIESPQMTALSDSISNERNTRVYLSTGSNKEAFHRLDGKWEGTKTEQIIQEVNSNHQCHSYSLEISWPDRISENQSGKTSEAGLDQKLKQDSSNSPCFKFYVSISNSSDGSTHHNGATQSILEFRSCMPDDFPGVKSGQVAVAVHESFFNSFGDDCDDDEFTSSSQGFLHWINYIKKK